MLSVYCTAENSCEPLARQLEQDGPIRTAKALKVDSTLAGLTINATLGFVSHTRALAHQKLHHPM